MAQSQSIAYCREDFPIFRETVRGKRFTYLDTASSAQKPQIVLDRMREAMATHYANIHRGLYHYSAVTTQDYESVRAKVADFINAPSADGVVFTRNTTEAINLIAQSWGFNFLRAGDEVILSAMEHHANLVPWQMLKNRMGIILRIIPMLEDGTLDLAAYQSMLGPKTRAVSIVHASNALGTINPVKRIIQMAKAINPAVVTIVDGSQSVVHGTVDVQDIGCDFFAFTGHKLYGPTGAGVLWGRPALLNDMPPYQGGGDMIETVTYQDSTFKPAPARFEAGTPAFIEIIGLGAAIDYLRTVGQENVTAHEKALLDKATQELARIDGLTFQGRGQEKVGIISMTAAWAHPSDIAMILDQQGVAIRTGHHCCMPLMSELGLGGTMRVSFGLYSNEDDIHHLVAGLNKARELLS